MTGTSFHFAIAGAVLAGAAALAASLPAHARVEAGEAAAMLHEKGYHHIQLDPDYKPGYQAYACRQETHFRIRMDADGNIADVSPVGACDPEEGPDEVHVRAPFADVRVGKDGVHVRAPFVDLNIR